MLKKILAFGVAGFENIVTSIAGLALAISGSLKGIGFDWVVTHKGHNFDLNLVIMAVSGGVLGWTAKQWNNHSTLQQVEVSTIEKQAKIQEPQK